MSRREGKAALKKKCEMLGLSMVEEYYLAVYILTSFQTVESVLTFFTGLSVTLH